VFRYVAKIGQQRDQDSQLEKDASAKIFFFYSLLLSSLELSDTQSL